jgi:hypothetical protein
MLRHIMIATAALASLFFTGVATAGTAGSDYGGQLVGKVTWIDRAQNLLVLDNSTELHANDQRLLANLRQGERVQVDFETRNGTKLIHEIRPAAPGEAPGVVPTTEGGTKQD